jgi:hypothetical protein
MPKQLFEPGKSGNPSGRPKSKPITDELKRIGTDEGGFKAIAKKLFLKALEGDVKAIREIFDRVEGKVTDKLTIETGDVDLMTLLTRKAGYNGRMSTDGEPATDTDVPSESGDAGDDSAGS